MEYLEIPGTSYEDGPTRYTYRLSSETNLIDTYFSISSRLSRALDIPFQMDADGFRVENQPHVQAIREALVNLIMHTDYFSPAVPRIRVFHDRIEFFNPGPLPRKLEAILREDFSLPRNPVIARAFRVMKLAENVGSGFHKMISGWKTFTDKDLDMLEDIDSFRMTFPLGDEWKKTVEKTTDKTTDKTSEKTVEKDTIKANVPENVPEKRLESILYHIQKDPRITIPELAQRLSVSGKTIKRDLAKLKETGRVKRIGPDKGGHWEVVE